MYTYTSHMKYTHILYLSIFLLIWCTSNHVQYETLPNEKENTVVICKDIRRFSQPWTHVTKETCSPIGHGIQFWSQWWVISAKHLIKDISTNYYVEKKWTYYPIINIWLHDEQDIVVFRIQDTSQWSTLHYELPWNKQLLSYHKFTAPSTEIYWNIVTYDAYTITHTLDIASWWSGSPIYDRKYRAVWIHTSYDVTKNTWRSLRFHPEIIERIYNLDFS